ADSRIEKTLKLDPGGRFVLDSDAGSVTLAGSSERGANIVITSNRDDLQDLLEFSFEDGPGTARVTARRRHHLNWHNLSVHYEIRVPTETQLDLRTGGGSMRVASIHGDSELKTSGGSMEVTGLEGRLSAKGNSRGGEVETSGGSIRVAVDPSVNLTLDASASGGGVSTDLPITVQGRISSSSVHGTLGAGGESLRLHTSGGSIHIRAL